MKFDERSQQRAQVAVQFAFALWVAAFAGMFLGTKLSQKSPTANWLVLFGPLAVLMGVAQVVTAERSSIRAIESKGIRHSSHFYVLLGIGFLVLGLISTVLGIAAWIDSPWFA